MSQFLIETFVWTGALIALVLLIRRPVARYFGPNLAYALWALPMARLLLPPLELPAWLAPQAGLAVSVPGNLLIQFEPAPPSVGDPSAAIPSVSILNSLGGLPWVEIGLAIWIIGAIFFLALRYNGYRKMRAEVLKEAVEVGREGEVRLVETPATTAPLAFGIRDAVVALPPGFMAQPNRQARDLALAHELAHHKGRDILVNFAVQPLFALHWFNPLGSMGWLALRRDQEAACDARVLAQYEPQERASYAATYAQVIASFAAGPKVALAAPMACPVLGEKSIIQRLRSLKMSDVSPSRRWAGRALIGAAVVTLPLTATISYAEGAAPAPPVAPAPPAAPMVSVSAPLAPVPPAPPVPPAALAPLAIQAASELEVEVENDVQGDEPVVIVKKVKRSDDGQQDTQVHRVKVIKNGKHLSDEEIEEMMVEVRDGLAEADDAIREAHEQQRIAIKMASSHNGEKTVIETKCDSQTVNESGDGQIVMVCKSDVIASALSGLKEARSSLAKDKKLDDRVRAQVLERIDEQIRKWEKDAG